MMIKVASTSDVIRLLQEYEAEHGTGAIHGISTICQGDRTVEYVFYISDQSCIDTKLEIPSVDLGVIFEED